MKIAAPHRRTSALSGVSGVARLDRRTKRLAGRLNPGDVAVIDHADLDRVTAELLVAAKVGAVVNAQPSISGRYPNLGPDLLTAHGIPLLDGVGNDVFGALKEGTRVRVDGDTVYVGDQAVATGTAQDEHTVATAMAAAREGLSTQLEAFAATTTQYLRTEHDLFLDGAGIPELRTRFAGRHVLVVVRGYHYREDLAALRRYIAEYRPVLVGVDGGADALHELGLRPDLIVGDMDAVSDEVLTCGAEVVVHAYADGRAPGLARVQDLNVDAVTMAARAGSEDLAMLLADHGDARLIVAVGTHATLEEFLDRGRDGMASTFLTRLRVGGRLVDAHGVRELYRTRISAAALLVLVLAAFVAIAAALLVTEAGRTALHGLGHHWDTAVSWVEDLFS